ncbi:uncharacterized protein LOC122016100 [Zingiber officinale]|uniref:uncharacterized protein LOC122016100 n=1 Tax=Zingiber officinale TaxID=94328 RepID=UPI001C4D9FDF|nr:uncharacterized protein LOC122016100 [Zingiber officinale]
MKKLGDGKGRKVHPAPAPQDQLAALPAAVLALADALNSEDQEVLAYLLSGGGRSWRERQRAHPPELGCACFGCYKSFWARWDASPNRHVIHRIIDAVEEGLENRDQRSVDGGEGRRRRQRRRKGGDLATAEGPELGGLSGGNDGDQYHEEEEEEEEEDEGNGESKSSVRRLMRFIGESVWGAWN